MIGKFSKRVLLTGAGWSRNWDGLLASEIWNSLIGHGAVLSNARLRDLLLAEPSFEAALGRTHFPPFTDADRHALEQAVIDIFVAMDRAIGGPHDPWINTYKVQELMFRFWGRSGEGNSAGYIFTTNQDLFPERFLWNELRYGAPRGALPGLLLVGGQNWFSPNLGPYSPAFVMQPMRDPASQARLTGQMNVIKLHGSFNWRAADGSNLLVVGTEKTAKIAAMPLLSWYAEIFRQSLFAGEVRLMVVGYGFGDEHINAVIAEAVEKHGLTLFIWDAGGGDLRGRMMAMPHGARIWKGLISIATRPLIEVFPSSQDETEEYRRIRHTFFG
jgi:hypothetical protein